MEDDYRLTTLPTTPVDVNSGNWLPMVRGTCSDNLAVARKLGNELVKPSQIICIGMIYVEPRQVCSLGRN